MKNQIKFLLATLLVSFSMFSQTKTATRLLKINSISNAQILGTDASGKVFDNSDILKDLVSETKRVNVEIKDFYMGSNEETSYTLIKSPGENKAIVITKIETIESVTKEFPITNLYLYSKEYGKANNLGISCIGRLGVRFGVSQYFNIFDILSLENKPLNLVYSNIKINDSQFNETIDVKVDLKLTIYYKVVDLEEYKGIHKAETNNNSLKS